MKTIGTTGRSIFMSSCNPTLQWKPPMRGIKDFYYKNLPGDFLKEVKKYKPFAQVVPMSTWHLYSEFKNGKPADRANHIRLVIWYYWRFCIAAGLYQFYEPKYGPLRKKGERSWYSQSNWFNERTIGPAIFK